MNGSPNLGQTTRSCNNQQQKTCLIMEFAVLADYRGKLKEIKKKEKYLDLARKSKNLWNMNVTVIPIVTGAFGTVTKGLVQGLEDLKKLYEWKSSKLQHCWDQPEYWEESWRLEETCHSNSNEKPLTNAGVKNSKKD